MNKRKILILSFFLFCIFYSHTVMAESYFRPNIEIPGMENFFSDLKHTGSYEVQSTTSSTVITTIEYTEYTINESGIVRYMQAIYSYSAVLAGVIAMFMMVFAAYQWLMAGGNAEKIGRAKETISSTLMGLTLLFGGYLLLSQISDRLVILSPINIPDVPMEVVDEINEEDIEYCAASFFSPHAGHPTIKSCADYRDIESCEVNRCFGLDYRFSTEPLNEVCINKNGACDNLRFQTCEVSADCQISNNPDSRDWCCEDTLWAADRCRPIGGQDGIDESDCKD